MELHRVLADAEGLRGGGNAADLGNGEEDPELAGCQIVAPGDYLGRCGSCRGPRRRHEQGQCGATARAGAAAARQRQGAEDEIDIAVSPQRYADAVSPQSEIVVAGAV